MGDEVTVEVLDVDMDRERVSLSLKATQEDPWRHFARTHAIGQIVPGKVTKLVPFGAFVRVEEGIEGLVHISELAERHVEVPDQVVAVGDDAMVKVIDIDLERRRISLSLKQANEDYTEEFDPAKYGMADSYDEQGNYIFPEGFDAETNEWIEGFDTQRTEWEARYAEAERRHKMHTAQMEKFAAAEAAGHGGGESARQRASGRRRRSPRVGRWPATPSWPLCGKSSPAALRLQPAHVMLRIGLTGGIGAGKSALSATFSQCGGIIVDGDVICPRGGRARAPRGWRRWSTRSATTFCCPDGALDRPALAAKAFADEEERQKLNGIVHPLVGKRRAEIIAAVARGCGCRGGHSAAGGVGYGAAVPAGRHRARRRRSAGATAGRTTRHGRGRRPGADRRAGHRRAASRRRRHLAGQLGQPRDIWSEHARDVWQQPHPAVRAQPRLSVRRPRTPAQLVPGRSDLAGPGSPHREPAEDRMRPSGLARRPHRVDRGARTWTPRTSSTSR